MRYLFVIFFFLTTRPALANCPDDQTVGNEYIIKVSKNALASQKLSSLGSVKVVKKIASINASNLGSRNHYKTTLPASYETLLVESVSETEIQEHFNPLALQKNCYVKTLSLNKTTKERTEGQTLEADPLYFHQKWYLDSVYSDATEPLEPKQEVIVAVTDTGVDINHKDLKNQIWINESELNGQTNFDDDGNGYVDDIYGYDVADNDHNPTPTTEDYYLDYDHGTHVAGLIGAELGNGFGTRGVTLNQVKILAVKGFRSKERTKLSDLIESIYYSVNNGAHIINASWGVDKEPEQAEIDAVNYALNRGVLVVAAAGNTGDPASWITPGSIEGVITVGSLNSMDQLSTFSNYGNSVDFLAPGGDGRERLNEYLLSAALDNFFVDLRGTSMAAPLVSGALSLTLSQRKDISAFQALRALYETSTDIELESTNGRDKRFYKKINVQKSIQYIYDHHEIVPLDPRVLSLKNLDDKVLESKTLSSQSVKSGSGCSMNHKKRATLPSALLSLMFLILPSTVLIKKRKRFKN